MTKITKLFVLIVLVYQYQVSAQTNNTKQLSKEELKTWYHKDFDTDTIPGVSLEKAYKEILANKKGQEIIVAVLDTKMDIYHEDLKDQIWINTDEIANNGIDDDKNGYIDDVHGWDFLSNTEGEFVKYEHLESTRIVRKYNSVFKDKKLADIADNDKEAYALYTKAFEKWENDVIKNKETLKKIKQTREAIIQGKAFLDSVYPKKEYKITELDSLIKVHENDSIITNALSEFKVGIQYNLTEERLNKYINSYQNRTQTMLNLDFDERTIPGDNADDINDNNYGSPIVYGDVPFQHATVVAGTLGAIRSNNVGMKGFSDNIKIMPVVMVASGDERDKDVALAIQYAVDNGAKVINMSWGKTLSQNEKWVNDAIKYAADKDVLLITAGGNENTNNDQVKYYLNDYNSDEKEFVDNFIVVGASTWDIQSLRASFSNYGKKHVDVFAPGVDMYTTEYGTDKYTSSRGTSLASPVVSGIAGLIRSYYPNLSAKEVKQILLESGISYDVTVAMKQEDGSVKQVPFSELSKSGKVVNAYNALVLAEKMSKNKK
ncbi:S8 family serine peptidase [uncultured Aquimarina sp.]|uniref:S8 family serine peptidase n=1 Tax=uncultured Aquimarina sp. TaxID=575652 RepID=UPI002617BA82|nr:S8 family serine peptidase [uncultured Aquimarina sp.]